MQVAPQTAGQQTSVKIYNAVYSSVQVYECMVRGIAVMRRRADSYVNATQILKVAGVDKGRRTKILEKEVLPGKHEIVQGGYGKYQGTWIPLERGRELALQYGIAHLLSPLFDFMPNSTAAAMSSIPGTFPASQVNMGTTRPLAPAASFPTMSNTQHHPYHSATPTPSHQLGPAPIIPGSALHLLQRGRAQGLFTPSTTSLQSRSGTPVGTTSYYPGLLAGYPSSQPQASSANPTAPSLKRTRTDSEIQLGAGMANGGHAGNAAPSASQQRSRTPDVRMTDEMRPASAAPSDKYRTDGESYSKRAKTDPPLPLSQASTVTATYTPSQPLTRTNTATSVAQHNGSAREDSLLSLGSGSSPAVNGAPTHDRPLRLASKAIPPSELDKAAPLKNMRRSAVMNAICQDDNATLVLEIMTDAMTESHQAPLDPRDVDWDLIIDDMGHTPLHLAASLARIDTVKALVGAGADIHRGNYQGETPLIRAILSTHNFDDQSFESLLLHLHPSIRTIDTAKRSVLHHATLTAGVRNRAVYAKYYMDTVLSWIAKNEGGDFRNLVDLQDEHGDTALNVAARVGNRSLVKSLLEIGANRTLANKLGLRPGDFGVVPEELATGPRAEDLLSSLRSPPSVPAQKSQDVIADLTTMIQKLSSDFAAEIKSKQDALDVTGAHLRVATRELADQRRQITTWQARCGEFDQMNQRIRNLEKATIEEDKFDWTGRTVDPGAEKDSNPAFAPRKVATVTVDEESVLSSGDVVEPPIPKENSLQALIRLRRMKMYQERMEQLLDARLKNLTGASAEKEFMCKKIVAICTGTPIDKVEDLLESFVIAVESESQIIDIGRVAAFMQKVRDGLI